MVGRVTPCVPSLAFAAGRGLPALPNCEFYALALRAIMWDGDVTI
jgi:hypothetical protein